MKYSWADVHQLEDAVASGRFNAEVSAALAGMDRYSAPARRDAALAELLAGGVYDVISAASFGAKGDGVTDDSRAIQAALDAALPGGTVYVPPTLAGTAFGPTALSLSVPDGVTLLGGNVGFRAGRWTNAVGLGAATVPGGTMLKITNTTTVVIKLGHNSTVKGFTFWYPNQLWNITSLAQSFVVYPVTVQLGLTTGALFHPQVLDCHFLGATTAMAQLDDTGNALNSLHVENVTGTVMGTLLRVYTSSDSLRLRNITVAPSYALNYVVDGEVGGDAKVFRTKIAQTLKLFEFGAVGDSEGINLYAFGCLYFSHYMANQRAGDPNQEGGGRWVNCVADLCHIMFRVERTDNISPLSLVNVWATPVIRPNGVGGDNATQALVYFAAGVGPYRASLQNVRVRGGSLDANFVTNYTNSHAYVFRAAGALGVYVNVMNDGCQFDNHTSGIADSNVAGVVNLGNHVANEVLQDFKHLKDLNAAGGYRQTIDGWYQDNVPANQTNVEITRAGGRFRAPRAGSITGLVIGTTEQRTGGTCAVALWINTGLAGAAGSYTGISTQLDAGNLARNTTYSAKDAVPFAAGDEIYVTVTTDGSWTPTTADIRAALEVET